MTDINNNKQEPYILAVGKFSIIHLFYHHHHHQSSKCRLEPEKIAKIPEFLIFMIFFISLHNISFKWKATNLRQLWQSISNILETGILRVKGPNMKLYRI